MKNLRKIVLLLLSLTLMFGLFACGGGDPCTEHTDENSDGKCDKCGEKVDTPPCDTCVDSDGDGKCDECGEAVEPEPTAEVVLFENGKAKFQIVLSKETKADVRKAVEKGIKSELSKKYKIDVTVVTEGSVDDEEADTEILIGTVKNRGEKYEFDKYQLGIKGYVIKLVDSKIIVNAGSDETLAETVERFAEDILGIGEKTLTDKKMTSEDGILEIQDDYKITSLAVSGTDMKGYTIATDSKNATDKALATLIQDEFYKRAGYRLEIVGLDDATDKSVIIKESAVKVYGDESFKISADGTRLTVEYSFANLAKEAVSKFLTAAIVGGSGDIDFTGTVFTHDISVVYYEDFGAVGDGVTDDYIAFYNTHKFANESGQTVKGNKSGKASCNYYLCNSYFIEEGASKEALHTIVIQTSVDWNGANITIDDRNILGDDILSFTQIERSKANAAVFLVSPNDEHKKIVINDADILAEIKAAGINPATKKIEINKYLDGWDGEVMIIPYNSSHKVHRHYQYSNYYGSDMREVIVLDKDGNVSAETPVVFEYTDISYIEVYKLDRSTAITLKNATFTTRTCQVNNVYYDEDAKQYKWYDKSVGRELNIQRSFTTVENVNHYITDEIPVIEQINEKGEVVKCAPYYAGFFSTNYATNVSFNNCLMTGRRCYLKPAGGTNGTYDISVRQSNKVVFTNCHQTNFWVTVDPDTKEITPATASTPGAVTSMSRITLNGKSLQLHWGVSLSSYCKNFEFIDSSLSRLDAHEGLYNGKVINTTVNYIELTGGGEFIFEDSTWYQSSPTVAFMALRSDYGSTWNGTVTIKNSKAFVSNTTTPKILNHVYYNWYFGYTTAVPNLNIDGLTFYDLTDVNGGIKMPSGTKIDILTSVTADSKIHLADSGTATLWAVTDNDGDGYIDEPLYDRDLDGFIDEPTDLDGDGVVGNTPYKIDEVKDTVGSGISNGYADPNGCTVNVNVVIPPEYIRIVNNNGGYVYNILSTADQGISDGLFYSDADSMGGFWGRTKFIYGEGSEEHFLGSGHKTQTDTKTFRFY